VLATCCRIRLKTTKEKKNWIHPICGIF